MKPTFDKVLALALMLTPQEQEMLVSRLRRSPTREELLKERETLRATPVQPGESLMGKYAQPGQQEWSEDEFHAMMREINTYSADEKIRLLESIQTDTPLKEQPSIRREDWYGEDGR